MTDDKHRAQWPEVFAAEIRDIRQRRRAHRDDSDLIGLALSGGGIRSATFALGVLESLRARGLLNRIDYLSTVSGGGYIGAWLSANCRRHPGWLETSTDWSTSIAHLRRGSKYLRPAFRLFSADAWSMTMMQLRNVAVVQILLVLVVATTMAATRVLFELFRAYPQAGAYRWMAVALVLVGAVGIAGNELRLSGRRGFETRWSMIGCVVALALAWLYVKTRDIDPFLDATGAGLVLGTLLLVAAFMLQPTAMRLAAMLVPGENVEVNFNYTQNWVQASIVIPLFAAAFLVSSLMWGAVKMPPPGGPVMLDGVGLAEYGPLVARAWLQWPLPLTAWFVSLLLMSVSALRTRRQPGSALAAFMAALSSAAVGYVMLCAVMLLFQHRAALPDHGVRHAFVFGPPLVTISFIVSLSTLIVLMGRHASEAVREWWNRLGAWLGIYATPWLLIVCAAVYGPDWARDVLSDRSLAAIAGGGSIGSVLAFLFGGKLLPTDKLLKLIVSVAPVLFASALVVGVAFVVDRVVLVYSGISWASIGASNLAAAHLSASIAVLLFCIAILAIMTAWIDLNDITLNALVRERLVRCFLGATRFRAGERAPWNFTGFDSDDDLRLSALSSDPHGPFHIVNCAMALGHPSDLSLYTRDHAPFVLTPLFCGSSFLWRSPDGPAAELGYVPTADYERRTGWPTLGDAVTLSGAGERDAGGSYRSAKAAFLLTAFSQRPGRWVASPESSRLAMRAPLGYLLSDVFGGAARSSFVRLSDGGDFDPLGAYELVRRRCRVIVLSDCENDPGFTFPGLGKLIRSCEVDFGVRITIDVSAIRRTADSPWSKARCAIGKIDYADGVQGVLLYMKAAMAGREDTAILQYRAANNTFPHQGAIEQFDNEDQFESYRRLGMEVAMEALDAIGDDFDALKQYRGGPAEPARALSNGSG